MITQKMSEININKMAIKLYLKLLSSTNHFKDLSIFPRLIAIMEEYLKVLIYD